MREASLVFVGGLDCCITQLKAQNPLGPVTRVKKKKGFRGKVCAAEGGDLLCPSASLSLALYLALSLSLALKSCTTMDVVTSC